jgi:3-(3-hydroxy-phenyl)propionate hydroxylase
MVPGAPAADAPLSDGGWLLRRLHGRSFAALVFDGPDTAARTRALQAGAEGLVPIEAIVLPAAGLAAERYDARPGTVVLLRPDQHVAARWREPSAADIAAALKRALALETTT